MLGVGLLTTKLEPPQAHAIFAALVAALALALAAILTGAASRKRQRRRQYDSCSANNGIYTWRGK